MAAIRMQNAVANPKNNQMKQNRNENRINLNQQ